MKIYVLVARGPLKYLSGRNTIMHKRAYVSKDEAEKNIDEFRENCSNIPFEDPRSMGDLDPEKVEVRVQELELVTDGNL